MAAKIAFLRRHILTLPWLAAALLCSATGSTQRTSPDPKAATATVPTGPRVYTPDQPGPTSDETPGDHHKTSEDKWGDHILTSYTIPPIATATPPPGRVFINDPRLGLAAETIDLPAGWKFEGSMHRDVACAPGDAEPAFRMTSRDGLSLEMMTPFFTRSSSVSQDSWNGAGCGITTTHAKSAAEILTRYILPSLQPGDTIVGKPERTQFAEDWEKQSRRMVADGSFSGEDVRIRLLLHNGKQEAWVGARTLLFHGSTGYEASMTTVFRTIAPIGRLEEIMKIGVGLHLDMNPEWVQKEQSRLQAASLPRQESQAPYPSIEEGRRPKTVDPGYHMRDYKGLPGEEPHIIGATVYYWQNAATGDYRHTTENVSPGPGWNPAK
jgi:hypothetical protein